MVVRGTIKRLAMGLWILAALLVLWYNGAQVTSLLDEPLPSLSRETRITIGKWHRLEDMVSLRLKKMAETIDLDQIAAKIDFLKVNPEVQKIKVQPAKKPIVKQPEKKEKEVQLPAVSGVVALYHADIGTTYMAVIDGEVKEEKSRIGEFVIYRINEKGVILAQGKDSWFVPAPKVPFSKDSGEHSHLGKTD